MPPAPMAPAATTASSATSAPVKGSDDVEAVGSTDGAVGVGFVTDEGPLGVFVWLMPELVVTDWADARAGAATTEAAIMVVPSTKRAKFVRIITSLLPTGEVPSRIGPGHSPVLTTLSGIGIGCPSARKMFDRNS